jgi:glycosyltransferase involved in cell wall biosynthesis
MHTGMPFSSVKADFDQLKACVIIPTFNNAATVGKVIEEVMQYCGHIIVVNDGSTDDTKAILERIQGIQIISYPVNKGKGWALRQAFSYAISKGYNTGITMDSDGQHFAADLPAFIEKLKLSADTLVMGARNMSQESVPGKSSFGHKFSNFWFKVETGIKCPDTQTGFRMYPLHLLKGMRFFTVKYEFEIEVIVRAAWKGIAFDSIPIKVYYAPKETRISHFRPFKDFTRISILNTIFVLITFFYIKPRNFFRTLFNRKKLKQAINDQLFNPNQSDSLKAISIAFGIFMGIVPIWGFQLAVGIFLSVLFRLNTALVIIAANISIPPMIPLIIFLSYKAGAWWMSGDEVNMIFSTEISIASIKNNLEQYIYGSITLALIAAILFGLISFVMLKYFKRKPFLA